MSDDPQTPRRPDSNIYLALGPALEHERECYERFHTLRESEHHAEAHERWQSARGLVEDLRNQIRLASFE